MPRRGGNRKQQGSGRRSNVALREYFRNRDGFSYRPSRPAWKEFDRLAQHLDWNKEEKAEERKAFKDVLVHSFNSTYGTDEASLESWTTLCQTIGITPVPDGLEACREAVKAAYVNLVDLVDHGNTGETIQVFATEVELSKYTRDTHKIFPKESAYAGGLLKHLLRHIMNPSKDRGATRLRRRRR